MKVGTMFYEKPSVLNLCNTGQCNNVANASGQSLYRLFLLRVDIAVMTFYTCVITISK